MKKLFLIIAVLVSAQMAFSQKAKNKVGDLLASKVNVFVKTDSIYLRVGGENFYIGKADQFFAAPAYFPTMDSLRNFINKYIRNSAIEAFTNLRLNTALMGLAQYIDSARLNGGGAGVDTLNDGDVNFTKTGNIIDNIVIKLQGRPFASTAPTDGQAIVWDNTAGTWKPATVAGSGGTVQVQNHVTGDGSSGSKLKLVNDAAVTLFPKIYGDRNGASGFFAPIRDSAYIVTKTITDTTESNRADQASIVEFPDGQLLIGYSHYIAGVGDFDSCKLAFKRSYDYGSSWRDVTFIGIPSGKKAVLVPSLYNPPGTDSVLCLALVGDAAGTTNKIYLFKSGDRGVTWNAGTDLGITGSYFSPASDRIHKDPKTGILYYPYDRNYGGDLSSITGEYRSRVLKSTNGGNTWTDAGIEMQNADNLSVESGIYDTDTSMIMYSRGRSKYVYAVESKDGFATISSVFNLNIVAPNSTTTIKRVPYPEKIWIAMHNTVEYMGGVPTILGIPARKFIVMDVSYDGKNFIRSAQISGDDTASKHRIEPNFFVTSNNKILATISQGHDVTTKYSLRSKLLDLGKLSYLQGITELPRMSFTLPASKQGNDTLGVQVRNNYVVPSSPQVYGALRLGYAPKGDSTQFTPVIHGEGYGNNNNVGLLLKGKPYAPATSGVLQGDVVLLGNTVNSDAVRFVDGANGAERVLLRASAVSNAPRIHVPNGIPLMLGEDFASAAQGWKLYSKGTGVSNLNFASIEHDHSSAGAYINLDFRNSISGSFAGFSGGNKHVKMGFQAGLAEFSVEAGQYNLTAGRSVDFKWYTMYPDNVYRLAAVLTTNGEWVIGNGPAVPGSRLYVHGEGTTSGTVNANFTNSSDATLFKIYNNGDQLQVASTYHNWGSTLGTSGYGFRDNGGTMEFKNSGGSWTAFGSGGLTDGDKGDITVTSSGTVWSIDGDVVSFAKMQNISTGVLLGRSTAGTGDIEEITVGSGLTLSAGTLTASAGTNIYNADGTLTGTRNMSGGSNSLSLGTNASNLGLMQIYASTGFKVFSSVAYGVDVYSTDATHTVPDNVGYVELSDASITANRAITLPSAATKGNGTFLTVINKTNNGSFFYTFGTTVTDNQTGATVTNIEGNTTYVLYVTSSLAWQVIAKYSNKQKVVTATDANYTVLASDYFVILPTITAGRNAVIPSAAGQVGRILIIKNANSSGNAWTFTGTAVKDGADATVSTVVNDTVYQLISDGTVWHIIN